MNWDAVGAVGQMLGSIAVFITLVYLAIQTRHARSDSRRALGQGRAEAVREINSLFLTDRASVWTKAAIALEAPIAPGVVLLMERAELTREEAWSVLVLARTFWGHVLQIMPNLHELSAMERHEFEGTIRFHYGEYGGPSRIFYETYVKTRGHPDAVRYVESVLAQPG